MPETAAPAQASPPQEAEIMSALGRRSVVLVGMMGAGKSTIGRRLAARLRLPFLDADIEIEAAAGMSIPDIFETHGEPYFRDGEARVIARLLDGGPAVIATGGGAFMREETRNRIRDKAVSIWLKADARRHHEARQAPRRPAAAADRGSGCDRQPPARSARAGLSDRRSHDRLARCAARPHRRRMYRCPARPAVRRRACCPADNRRDERHAMTAP